MQLFKDPSNRNYCFDWLNGRCSADPCRFVHDDSMSDQTKGFLKRAHKLLQTPKMTPPPRLRHRERYYNYE